MLELFSLVDLCEEEMQVFTSVVLMSFHAVTRHSHIVGGENANTPPRKSCRADSVGRV